jgi:hypothetical protein
MTDSRTSIHFEIPMTVRSLHLAWPRRIDLKQVDCGEALRGR